MYVRTLRRYSSCWTEPVLPGFETKKAVFGFVKSPIQYKKTVFSIKKAVFSIKKQYLVLKKPYLVQENRIQYKKAIFSIKKVVFSIKKAVFSTKKAVFSIKKTSIFYKTGRLRKDGVLRAPYTYIFFSYDFINVKFFILSLPFSSLA